MSVSHALGSRLFDIMLISVHGTTPKYSSIAVQHCTDVPANSFTPIHSSTTTPNFAIFISDPAGIPSVLTYPRIPSSFAFTLPSPSPSTSDKSTVSTVIPARSSSFSLNRTVLNAAGRAPITPTRSPFKPFTTRHVAANILKSSLNPSDPGHTVCSRVSVYRIPYCHRLLHTDIFPQKLSRRPPISIFPASSGYACTSTGTSSPLIRSAFATPRSSPKFGSVTTTPSISSRCRLNNSAHFRASSSVSTAPCFVSSGPRQTTPYPSASSTRSTSSRPSRTNASGKNPRFPTITPNVVFPIPRPPQFPAAVNQQTNSDCIEGHLQCGRFIPAAPRCQAGHKSCDNGRTTCELPSQATVWASPAAMQGGKSWPRPRASRRLSARRAASARK